MRNGIILLILLVVFSPDGLSAQESTSSPQSDSPIPARPEELKFKTLSFTPPEAKEYRHVLPGGVPVYLAPSRELPLVQLTFTFKGGRYLDPDGKEGLAAMTGTMMRRGGTKKTSAEAFDERLDFLAANVSASCGTTSSRASLDCLSTNLDECLTLFVDMVKTPGFQQDRINIYREEALEDMKQRNDNADAILQREWNALLYGRDHFLGRVTSQGSLAQISIKDMEELHKSIFHPGNLIIGVNGDFDSKTMLEALSRVLSGWESGTRPSDPPVPTEELSPELYRVEKDIPQGKVIMGMRSIKRDDPDYFPLLVMNSILGGSGFTSRITSRVRSDEGLAYSAGSSLSPGVHFPGTFGAFFQSKNRTVALAAKIIREEIERIQKEPVTDEELTTAKNSFIETFPQTFASKTATVGILIQDEWTNRSDGFWKTYREKVDAVTKEDVLRVSKQHLQPGKLAMLVVGKWSDIEPGDLDGRASMQDLFSGKSTELPLRDPLTQEPLTGNP